MIQGRGGGTSEVWRNITAFWILGCLNNTAYVVMNAASQSISPGGVGLVYLCNVGPSLLTKLTLPYWGDLVGYRTRMILATISMVLSFVLVARGGSLAVRLIGVSFSAFQSGLGEASMLGLTAKVQLHMCVTM